MRRVMPESSLPFLLVLNSIVSMTLHLGFSEASSANTNNSWCSLSSCTRSFRGIRSVDTIDGQLVTDLKFQGRVRRRALMRRVMAESICFHVLEQHRVNDILRLGCVRSHKYKREEFLL